jgi:hypothetical protein
MNTSKLVSAVLVLACPAAFFAGGEEEPAIGRLLRYDVGKELVAPINDRPFAPGDLLEFFSETPTVDKALTLKELRVEITTAGDPIIKLGVVENSGILAEDPMAKPDKSKRRLSYFVAVVKTGKGTIKVTPVLQNGKHGPVFEMRFVSLPRKNVPRPSER